MFLHLSVSHSVHGRGCLCMIPLLVPLPGVSGQGGLLDRPPPRDPLDRDPLDRDPLDRDPPGQRPPMDRDPHVVKSRWYASYWNVFLFDIKRILWNYNLLSSVSHHNHYTKDTTAGGRHRETFNSLQS